jgi:hypothetical protein
MSLAATSDNSTSRHLPRGKAILQSPDASRGLLQDDSRQRTLRAGSFRMTRTSGRFAAGLFRMTTSASEAR